MKGLLVKPGVTFATIRKAGFRILGALDATARELNCDLTITCGSDAHGETDPHTLGEAFDVRTHGLDDDVLSRILSTILRHVADDDDPIRVVGSGLATRRFYVQREHAGEPDDHLHVQRRKGTRYQ